MSTHTRPFLIQQAVDLAASANLVFITKEAVCPVIRISQFGDTFTVSAWIYGVQVEIPVYWNDIIYLVDEAHYSRLMVRHGEEAQ